MRVLQIEDDESTAQAVVQTLKSKGFTCDTASLGEEALELAARHHYDLILLDIMLPDIDGYEVLRRLRDADIHAPVVIQTALIGHDDAERAESLGTMGRLIKPFNGSDLGACVASVLERAGSEDAEPTPQDPSDPMRGRRRHKRIKTLKSGEIADRDLNHVGKCLVINMSIGGAALKVTEEIAVPETFFLKLQNGQTHRCHVCWRHDDKIGVMFVHSPA